MGRKFPYMQLYVNDLLNDIEPLGHVARDVWLHALMRMHLDDQCGMLKGDVADVCRLCRCTVEEMIASVAEFQKFDTGDCEIKNGFVTLVNRRMRREWRARNAANNRQKRKRGKCRHKNESVLSREESQNVTGLKQGSPPPLPLPSFSSSPVPLSPNPPQPPPQPPCAAGGREEAAENPMDGDEVDTEIRSFIATHPMILYNLKTHANLRKLVEVAGWNRAKSLIDEAVQARAKFPVGWALGKAAGEESRNTAAGAESSTQAKARQMAAMLRKS